MDRDLFTLFGDPGEPVIPHDFQVPRLIPGAHAAPELCQLLGRWTVAGHPADAIGQVKLDGRRVIYADDVLLSREGIFQNQALHSMRALHELERSFGKPMMFDGEYVHPDGLDSCHLPGGTVWLFDAVPLEQWRAGDKMRTAPLIDRIDRLLHRGQYCFGPALGALKPFDLGGGAGGAKAAVLKAEAIWAAGYEGIVVKSASSEYERRRTSSWLKLKDWRTETFRVVESVSENGMVSMLLVMANGQPQKVALSNVSRASRAQLHTMVTAQTKVRVEHCGLTKNGLLREPVFQGVDSDG